METTDTLIAKADPYPAGSLGDIRPGLDSLCETIAGQDRPVAARRMRRSRRRLVLAVAVIGVLTGIAAGATYTTHTGVFGRPNKTENDTTEFLRVDAPDFPALALKLAEGIPFPPGDSAKTYLPFLVKPDNVMQAAGIRGMFAFNSMCAWQGYWLEAHRNGDAAKEAAAVKVLRAIPTWKAITAVDNGGALYASFAADAAKGKAGPIQYFWNVNCQGTPRPWSGR